MDSSPPPFLTEKESRLSWWYRLTTPEPEAITQAARDRTTHARLLAIMCLLLLAVITVLIPATLFIPNPHTLQLCLATAVLCGICLGLNRAGKTQIACVLMIISIELAIGLVIWTTRPFDTFNLPLFDIFIIAELLTVSLLPAASVFVILLVNVAFIAASLSWQVHTPQLEAILHTQYYNSLIRPVAVQLVVAVVSYVWVKLTAHATFRADQAEMIARLEHELLEQAQLVAQQKAALEQDIQALVAMHKQATNGEFQPTPYSLQSSILFPLRTAFSLLSARLRRAYQVENEHVALMRAISEVAQSVRAGHPVRPTHTDLDTLLLALQQQKSAKNLTFPRKDLSQ